MYQSQTKAECQYRGRVNYTISTLLIPSNYILHYEKQCHKHGNRRKYFRYLLICFSAQVKLYENFVQNQKDDKWKIYYQDQGLCLQRKNFRPDPEFWEQLRHMSIRFGVSMAYLFVFLMELEMGVVILSLRNDLNHSGLTDKSKIKNWNRERANSVIDKGWNTNKFCYKNKKIIFECTRRIEFDSKKLYRSLIWTI